MDRYQAILQVLSSNSFSNAARALGYTQSAVSQMVKALEAELGVTLLVRSRTGVSLTHEGSLLLPFIRDAANANRRLMEQAENFRGLHSGVIRIGSFTSISSRVLPPVIKQFKEEHPGIRFELHQGLYEEIEDWVHDGVVDFGFTDMLRSTSFVFRPLLRDTMLAVLPEGHPLGENLAVTLEELSGEPFILLDEGPGDGCLHSVVEAHPELDVQYRVADDYSIMTMVENHLGIALLPEMIFRTTNRRVIARQLRPAIARTVGVIYQKKTGLGTAANVFLRELKRSVGDMERDTLFK